MSRIRARIDTMEIDSDEDGWHLRITDDDGIEYDFNFHGVAFDFAGSPGLLSLREWRGEGESIRAEVRAARSQGATARTMSMQCNFDQHRDCPSDMCQCDCHTLSTDDPKNPLYRDTMVGDH